jgi:hypothetical protein
VTDPERLGCPLRSSPVRPGFSIDARLLTWAWRQQGPWMLVHAVQDLNPRSNDEVLYALWRLIERGLIERTGSFHYQATGMTDPMTLTNW